MRIFFKTDKGIGFTEEVDLTEFNNDKISVKEVLKKLVKEHDKGKEKTFIS